MTVKKVLSGAHLEMEINLSWYSRNKLRMGDIEGYAKDLQSEAASALDFLRDHRSLDIHDISVVREYEWVCEYCKRHSSEAETYHPECCEKAIREWATPEQLIEFGYEVENG